jgi:hypothetical protein
MKGTLLLFATALAILVAIMPSSMVAQDKPVNIALFNPVQVFPEGNSIGGLRINFIYGKNVKMTGFDWGLVNAVGSGGCSGVEWGLVNMCEGNFVGWQSGLVNLGNQNVEGFQWGWYNAGDHVSGFQLGLVNSAQTMKGLQIGLVNIIKTGGQFPVFPIANWSF